MSAALGAAPQRFMLRCCHPDEGTFIAEITLTSIGAEGSAEDALIDQEELDRIKVSVLSLFDDDPTTKLVMEGIMADLEGSELRELAGIDENNLATRRKLIKRRIKAAFPKGWHHDD